MPTNRTRIDSHTAAAASRSLARNAAERENQQEAHPRERRDGVPVGEGIGNELCDETATTGKIARPTIAAPFQNSSVLGTTTGRAAGRKSRSATT